MEKTVNDFKLEHINTGCLYEPDGQKITIAYESDRKAYFFDHSRGVDGAVVGANLNTSAVIRAYVYDLYTSIDIEPYHLKYEFDKFYKEADFIDYSFNYSLLF